MADKAKKGGQKPAAQPDATELMVAFMDMLKTQQQQRHEDDLRRREEEARRQEHAGVSTAPRGRSQTSRTGVSTAPRGRSQTPRGGNQAPGTGGQAEA